MDLPTSTPAHGTGRHARRRAVCLVIVHLLFAAHVVHWRLAGKTLAPLELNELMYTLEAGIVTAGFLFMVLVVLSVAVFGRFFCSWGCHVLALQDASAWLLRKLRLRPRTVRTRALALVPMGAMLYMFVWPQVRFVLFDVPRPRLHVAGDESGWASFVTTDFWRNLPGPGIALLTFFVCGFAMVALFGPRAFCRFGCPYGAIFGLFDRVAPGRIARVGDCSSCGRCTAVCQSDVRVHEELLAHGQVVNPACLRDLDCVDACPEGAVAFRMRGSAALRGATRRERVPPKRPSLSRREEWVVALAFVPLLLVFRGLYGRMPFLLSLGLAGSTAFLAVVCVRTVRDRSVILARVRLVSRGRLRPAGWAFAVVSLCWLLFVAHSSLIRIAQWRGRTALEGGVHGWSLEEVESARASLRLVERYGLFSTPGTNARLAVLAGRRGELLADDSRLHEARIALAEATYRLPEDSRLRFNHGRVLAAMGNHSAAAAEYRAAARLDPEDAQAHNNLGHALMELGRPDAARIELERAVALGDLAHAHFNLGRLALEAGNRAGATACFERAARRDPAYSDWLREFRAAGAPR